MNIQNIPRGDTLIKKGLGPKFDALVSFDYSQIEYRLLAYYLSVRLDDESMADVFRSGRDVHAETARLILRLPADAELTDKERQRGKTGNFSIVYAGGVPTIQRQQAIAGDPVTREEAKEILKAIRTTMPGVYDLDQDIQTTVKERGYLRSILGRILYPDPKIPERDARRKMLNALMQGGAADIMRNAIVECTRWRKAAGIHSQIICMVHDDMIWDAVDEEIPLLYNEVPKLMMYPKVSDVVPLEVDCVVGRSSWAEKEKYE